MRIRNLTLFSGAVLLVLVCNCGKTIHRAYTQGNFDHLGRNIYQFENSKLHISFGSGPDKRLRFHIKNKTRRTITIFYEDVWFFLRDKTTGETQQVDIWGRAIVKTVKKPPIIIKPFQFFSINYPILFKNPLYPFDLEKRDITLSLTINTNNKRLPYELSFIPDA